MRRKTERRWTVMLVPHGSGASRAVELSQTVVKALVGIGSVIALLFLVLGGAAIARGVSITRSRALERENRVLADEIQRMRERLVGLRDTLTRFSAREQELRLLAGLNFFFQAEDGIRDLTVTGVQTCALPICTTAADSLQVSPRLMTGSKNARPRISAVTLPRSSSLLTSRASSVSTV